MATATLLTTFGNEWPTAVASVTSPSITPGANCLLVLLVGATDDNVNLWPATFTSSGSGPTWTSIVSADSGTAFVARAAAARAVIGGSDPGSFTVTVDFTGSSTAGAVTVAIYKVTGYDTGTPIGGKVAQAAQLGQGPETATLDAAPASSDITLALNHADGDAAPGGAVFDTGWTEDADGAAGSLNHSWNVGQRTGSTSTTVAWTDVNTAAQDFTSAQVAVVVKSADVGITGTVAVTLSAFTSSASGAISNWETFDDGVSATPGATVTGLTNGVTYEFRVAAVNSVGQGAWSNIVTETPADAGITGTGSPTLGAFTSTASGELQLTGTVAVTLAAFISSASGAIIPPPVSGSGSPTLAPFTSTATGIVQIVGTSTQTLAAFTSSAIGTLFAGRYPASVSGRKLLDQNGDPIIVLTASAWSLPDLSDANITAVLEGLRDAGFNGITAWQGGGYSLNASWDPPYERKSDSSDWWTGTAWQSTFGAAWDATDHIAAECVRLDMVFSFSICGGFDTTGAGPEWEAATNAEMVTVGETVANRYPIGTYPNIIWHLMLDDANTPGSTRGLRANAYFEGINNIEGSTRPVRWMEPANGTTVDTQGWLGTGEAAMTVNAIYEYSDSHVVEIEGGYADAVAPLADCEPPYDGSPNAGASHAGIRIRVASIYIEGGCLINWGHEDLWPFGKTGLFTESLTYTQVLSHSATMDAGRIFQMVRPYVEDMTWAPVTTFVTTGEGTGTSKAAQGASDTAALACFPNSRSIQINTTILTGTDPVQIRWFDPTDGTYDIVTSSEAQQSGRSVTHPGTNTGGGTDWILVVEPTNDRTGSLAETLSPFTSSATGVIQIVGTAAETLDAYTSSSAGTVVANIGTVAETLAAFTSTATGTATPPPITGSLAVTLDPFTATATGTFTLPPIIGTTAVTLDPFTSTASGAFTPPNFTGTVAETLDPFTADGVGVFIPAGSGAAAVTLDPFTATATGTHTPNFTGTVAVTLDAFTSTSGEISAFILSDVTGPATVTFTVTGPALRRTVTGVAIRRQLTGPATVTVDITGPDRQTETVTGPETSRTLDGPETSRTLTGPGV